MISLESIRFARLSESVRTGMIKHHVGLRAMHTCNTKTSDLPETELAFILDANMSAYIRAAVEQGTYAPWQLAASVLETS